MPAAARRPALVLPRLVLAGALLSAPAAFAQAVPDQEEFKGYGAALCIVAGELLAQQPGADAGIRDTVLAWRQVMHVLAGTDEQRQAAVDSARASLAASDEARVAMLESLWPSVCTVRDMQVRYIASQGDRDRVRLHLADEPGSPLSAAAVDRLNASVSCLAGAELLARSRPARPLRDALRAANPPIPPADVLQAIQVRSRQEIDGLPGSAVGKELVVDYLRYMYDTAASGDGMRAFVSFVSRALQERCLPAEG